MLYRGKTRGQMLCHIELFYFTARLGKTNKRSKNRLNVSCGYEDIKGQGSYIRGRIPGQLIEGRSEGTGGVLSQ